MFTKRVKFMRPLLLSFLAATLAANACCTAWRHGAEPVEIATQDVLVAWDAESQTEHFVRRANFLSENTPEDFGFLVPTPTQPKLSEVPDVLFHELGEIIKPEVKVEKSTRLSLSPLVFSLLGAEGEGAVSTKELARIAGVEVLDSAMVGGFEATVLRVSDTESLFQWFEDHEYDARPELREWVAPYVQKQWVVTAFKYACEPEEEVSRSLPRASVCLSFETSAPFFPYRVPSDIRVKPEEGSLLRIYFAGTERVLGEFESGPEQPWQAVTKFSQNDERVEGILAKSLGGPVFGAEKFEVSRLTVFEDKTWPGGAEDLYFRSSPETGVVIPPPIVKSQISTIHLPVDLLLGIIVLFYAYRRFTKRRSEQA